MSFWFFLFYFVCCCLAFLPSVLFYSPPPLFLSGFITKVCLTPNSGIDLPLECPVFKFWDLLRVCLFLSIWMFTTYLQCLLRPKGSVRSPGTGETRGFEQPSVSTGNWTKTTWESNKWSELLSALGPAWEPSSPTPTSEFKVSPVYRASSKTARDTQKSCLEIK